MSEHQAIVSSLKEYVIDKIMEGDAEGLENDSPLLNWGVLNSLEIVHLRVFIQDTFGVIVSDEQTNASNFESLNHIASLVQSLQGGKLAANA